VADTVRRHAATHHDSVFEPAFDGARPSAVLVLLADGPDGAEVLLTRRTMQLSSHRGEVSCPGGRLDSGESYEEAAVRETWEEVGIDRSRIDLVGRLDPIATVVSRSWIVPVVGVTDERHEPVPQVAEVDRAFWHPLADLTRPGTFREEIWRLERGEWPVYFFELDDETVWGATARILHQVLQLAHG
jgi:8-oxo-dGTP pyrophosphatase MutT (NUDIX family)